MRDGGMTVTIGLGRELFDDVRARAARRRSQTLPAFAGDALDPRAAAAATCACWSARDEPPTRCGASARRAGSSADAHDAGGALGFRDGT